MLSEPSEPTPMRWWLILVILAAVGILVGIAIALLGEIFGFATGWSAAGVGAAVGVVGVFLINRRRLTRPGGKQN